ncbi:hypothetical protein C8N46_109131 [Kordia periserrulae]|uniref:Uncharacterized protein n=1 Tax=Kordia periserrulae TaxID=701523 RepID=A0A2T6BU06_9FLAO|nr:hypothetical protein [Kordia periserrulae]PTX59542.1 hypothetical protein C8N46_109131 [Kordia periserrulae]
MRLIKLDDASPAIVERIFKEESLEVSAEVHFDNVTKEISRITLYQSKHYVKYKFLHSNLCVKKFTDVGINNLSILEIHYLFDSSINVPVEKDDFQVEIPNKINLKRGDVIGVEIKEYKKNGTGTVLPDTCNFNLINPTPETKNGAIIVSI